MINHSADFGYYPGKLDISIGNISISTLPCLEESISIVENDSQVSDDWIYAPQQEAYQFGGTIKKYPYPTRIFALPKTHKILHTSADNDEHLAFHIWTLSFFTGLRLTSTQAGFIDSTPIKIGKLFDFLLIKSSINDTISLSENFWIDNRKTPERSKLVTSIIHTLLLSQNPRHLQFEKFLLLYSALDACFALAKSLQGKSNGVTHSKRISWLCELYNIPIPEWAASSSTPNPEIAYIRNESVHEALFMGEPLGFALHGVGTNKNINLEIESLICRLLVALLGSDKSDYVTSPVSTRQIIGLTIKK